MLLVATSCLCLLAKAADSRVADCWREMSQHWHPCMAAAHPLSVSDSFAYFLSTQSQSLGQQILHAAQSLLKRLFCKLLRASNCLLMGAPVVTS